MTDDLDSLLDTITELEDEEDDGFPWVDAATWTADGSHQEPDSIDVPGCTFIFTARLGDGRTARWSMATGWSGDPEVVNAAWAVAGLYQEMGEVCAAARGLIGVSVDGVVDEACWVAARL